MKARAALWLLGRCSRCFRRRGAGQLGDDLHRGPSLELLVVRVADDLLDVNRPRVEVELVIGDGVRRKPELSVDLLAVGGKPGEQVLLAVFSPGFRNVLAFRL